MDKTVEITDQTNNIEPYRAMIAHNSPRLP